MEHLGKSSSSLANEGYDCSLYLTSYQQDQLPPKSWRPTFATVHGDEKRRTWTVIIQETRRSYWLRPIDDTFTR